MDKIKRFFTKKVIIILAVVLIIVLFFVFKPSGGNETKYSTAQIGTVVQEINITGKVKPTKNVDLAFEKGGRVSAVYANASDKVESGQRLVELENLDYRASLLQAQASLDGQVAKLDELKKGTRVEEIAITKAELNKQKQDLEDYIKNSIDVLNDAYVKSDDAVRNKVDALFDNDESNSPQLSFATFKDPYVYINSQVETDAEYLRLKSRDALNQWNAEMKKLSQLSTPQEISLQLSRAKTYLNVMLDFFEALQVTLQNSPDITQATITTYKTNATAGRTNIVTALTNINNQEQLIKNQELSVAKQEDQLNLQLAGSTEETIRVQESLVKNAEAQVANYQAQLEKTIIRAPFSGTITRKDVTVGEIVNANQVLMAIVGAGAFEMEANVSESDVAKLTIGDTAKVTLDAYGSNVVWTAKVVDVDISETIVDGVPTYKTRFLFDNEDERVRSGFTANIDVLTDQKDNVLYIPSRSIITRDGKQYIKVVIDEKGTIEERNIEIGLRGSDGRTVVSSGLKEGDKIFIE